VADPLDFVLHRHTILANRAQPYPSRVYLYIRCSPYLIFHLKKPNSLCRHQFKKIKHQLVGNYSVIVLQWHHKLRATAPAQRSSMATPSAGRGPWSSWRSLASQRACCPWRTSRSSATTVRMGSCGWCRGEKKVEHTFKKIKQTVSYASEVTAFAEKGKLKNIAGVKTKELFLWLSVVEVYVPESSPEKVTFKTGTGLSDSFDATAFALGE